MKNNLINLFSIIVISLVVSGCNPKSFSSAESAEITRHYPISNFTKSECIDNITIYPTNDTEAIVWECDTEKGSKDGLYLTDKYLSYSYYATYDLNNEMLSVKVYSHIMSHTFSSKEDMENKVFPVVINEINNLQYRIDKKEKHKKAKQILEKSFNS